MFRWLLITVAGMVTCVGGRISASECPVSDIQVHIVDEAVKGSEVLTAAEISDTNFRTFVMTVMKQISSGLACIANTSKSSELYFVRQPLVTSGNEPLNIVPTLGNMPSDRCRITSPWIDLSFERTPEPWVRGIVRWSERQLLIDQAVLAGDYTPSEAPPEPLTQSDFERLAQDYSDSEILGLSRSEAIENRIPADILWLFRHSWQSTRGPFSGAAIGAMNAVVNRSREGYTKIVLELIDRCFAPGLKNFHVFSVLDLADVISLEQYRIENLLQ